MAFIVAEIGVNWDGNFDLLKNMMETAKSVGFDAVKFQSFNESIVKEHPEKTRLMKSSITTENIEYVNSLSKRIGIEWFATPMYQDAIDFLSPFVSKFKIRVADGKTLYSTPSKLVDSILDTDKEIIISVEKPPPKRFVNSHNIKWLYCVAKYPCTFSDLDFTTLKHYDGFSNHCPHIVAPLKAFVEGAKIIEVHVTSNKNQNFLDNPVSFDYEEQRLLLDLIQNYGKIKS